MTQTEDKGLASWDKLALNNLLAQFLFSSSSYVILKHMIIIIWN